MNWTTFWPRSTKMSNNNNDSFNNETIALQDANVVLKPRFPRTTVGEVVQRLYGLQMTDIKELPSYDDLNFHIHVGDTWNNENIEAAHEHGYVLKVLNALQSSQPAIIDAEHALCSHVRNHEIQTQIPVMNKEGKLWSLETCIDSKTGTLNGPYLVRLLTFIPGTIFLNTPYVPGSFYNIGKFVGKLHRALESFHHSCYDGRRLLWNMTELSAIHGFTYVVENKNDLNLVQEVVASYEKHVIPRYQHFTKGVIHGDLNDQNIIMMEIPNQRDVPADQRVHDVTGLLDFSDVISSYRVMDIAVCLTYLCVECPDGLQVDAVGHALAGFLKFSELNEHEFWSLKILVCSRLCQSLVYGAHSFIQQPENTYLLATSERGWPLLRKLWGIDEDILLSRWREIIQGYEQ